jgi:hypothetical protein
VTGATNVIAVTPSQDLQSVYKNAKPGDVLELAAGTYTPSGGLDFSISGTASSWIVVRGAAGTRPVIDLGSAGELHIGASYFMLENVSVVNGSGNNIHIIPSTTTVPTTNVIVKDVSSTNMAAGTGSALKIAGNWNNGTGVPTDYVYVIGCELAGSRDNALCDAVAVRHAVMRGCYLHDPVVISMSSPGAFFKGGSNEILMENNLFCRIHGNAAVMLGGDTGGQWFDPLYTNPKIESVDEVVRNNFLADFDDAAFEVRGAQNAKIYNNTVVTESSFSIYRFSWGGAGSGTQIGNHAIAISDDLVLATSSPRTAENDGNSDLTVTFGPTLWGGSFSGTYGSALPTIPVAGSVQVAASGFSTVLANPSYSGLTGLADALARYALVAGSPARGAGAADGVPYDAAGTKRPSTPSLGALE